MHLFVCQHGRPEGKSSCAAGWDSVLALVELKGLLREAGLESVRVSKSGCLGPCEKGPNLLLYPQRIWFHQVRQSDLPDVVRRIVEITSSEKAGADSQTQP